MPIEGTIEGVTSLPDPRNQPVSDSLCEFLVARQLILEGSVFQDRSHHCRGRAGTRLDRAKWDFVILGERGSVRAAAERAPADRLQLRMVRPNGNVPPASSTIARPPARPARDRPPVSRGALGSQCRRHRAAAWPAPRPACVAIAALDDRQPAEVGDASWRKCGRLARGQGEVVLDVERVEALGGWKRELTSKLPSSLPRGWSRGWTPRPEGLTAGPGRSHASPEAAGAALPPIRPAVRRSARGTATTIDWPQGLAMGWSM
jgi:hypothetical protein